MIVGPRAGAAASGVRWRARRVAQEAHAVVSRYPDLAVGVITFYAAQRDEILASMRDVDLTEADRREPIPRAGSVAADDRRPRAASGRHGRCLPGQGVRRCLPVPHPLEPGPDEGRG